nr:hypothetical transcript [Hymenolepis microstoma]
MDLDICTPHSWTREFLLLITLNTNYLIALILIVWACLVAALIIAKAFRGSYFHENNKFEETYRDGGRRNSGLLITYFVVKLASCNAFFEASDAVYQGGIGGAFFPSISSCVAITLLAPLSVELKTKAPGARTFLQVIRTRFGTTVHIIYCVCAIGVNLGMMLEVSSRALAALVETSPKINKEVILAIIIFVVGVTVTIGGIFSLFCNSYIISAILTFAVVLVGNAVFFSSGLYPLGDCLRIYTLTSCQTIPNTSQTVLTFRSSNTIALGVKQLGVMLVFQVLDQAIWQGILSSEPETGGFSLIAGGAFYFPVAVTFGTACGLGYMALNMSYGQVMLPRFMERIGLMAHSLTDFLFGAFGTLLINIMLVLSMVVVISTEVVSISSIFVYDVYMTYIYGKDNSLIRHIWGVVSDFLERHGNFRSIGAIKVSI